MMDSRVSKLKINMKKKYKRSHFYLILMFLDWEYIKINFTGFFLFNKDFIVSKWPLKHPIHFNPTLLGDDSIPIQVLSFSTNTYVSNILIHFSFYI